MRGKVHPFQNNFLPHRITPACAGKRFFQGGQGKTEGDHPRLCGEKLRGACNHSKVIGSPPPVRGKECLHYFLLYFLRITPACAGKSERFKFCLGNVGSPPPVRGKAPWSFLTACRARITPACAGKSFPMP